MANISQEKKDMQTWINTEVERRVKEAMEQQEEFEEQQRASQVSKGMDLEVQALRTFMEMRS